ncbi:putative HC-toxin synthetase [Glarea lozoyensis 74030]|uniref:Putative HC-toxin synthetase n=1 Tax=Glarea lozoyensis (strain ATCC 74030 / MF5533) TaxID=1104152 RepID=H0EUP5_GLAL7|nr:putative HC-toxin synthetase [Glarea lozoyensis 74030]
MSIAELLLEIQSQAAKMIEHEHTGLQTIKKLLPEFGTALELRNLLIVQPEAESDDYVYKEFPGLEAIREAMEDFDNYGLNVECILGSQSIEVLVNYDDHVINTMHLRDVMGQFTYTVQCLCNPSVSKLSVNDVATIKTSDQQRILEWNEHIPPSVDRCIHHLVQDQVNIQPAKLAVDAWLGLAIGCFASVR